MTFNETLWQYLADQCVEESDDCLKFSVHDNAVSVDFLLHKDTRIILEDYSNQDEEDAFSMAHDFIDEIVEDFFSGLEDEKDYSDEDYEINDVEDE